MGGNHEYGSGDAPRDDSRGYGGGQRGYGGRGDDRGYGGQAPPPGQGDPGGSGPTRSYGEPPGGGGGRRGYGQGSDSGQNAGSGQSAGGGQRGYGSPPAGGAGRPGGYGERPRGYERPVDSYGESSRRRPRGPVPGEVVPPDPDPAARRSGALPGQSTRGYDDPVTDPDSPPDGPPRRSRVEERRAARNGGDGSTEPEEREYAPGQERSSRYGRSALDGRRTRNGAARNVGNRSGRPVKKTGYHRYFDYPRTGKLGWRRWMPSIKQVCSAGLACIFLMIGLFVYEYATVQIPSESSIELAQSTNYTYDDGSTVFATTGSVNRENVNISEIPKTMQNAIVAAEDKTFWSNPGISVTGIARAFLNDAEGKDQLQGGSTLTQQFVKNAYLTDNQTFSRKFKEIFIALKIGQTKSKDWVLENYLNTVFFGRNADGIQEGSQAWFGESASQLTDPSHAAFMAALVNQPTNFSLGFSSDSNQAEQTYWQGQLKERWKAILDNMLSYGMITKAQWTTATANFPTPVNPSQSTAGSPLDQQMQNAVDSWISTYATANPNSGIPTPDQIASGGYTVETTFNKQYMADAQQAVQDQFLSQIEENSSSWYNQNLYPSLAAVDPSTGDLIAFYGGTTSFNYATQGQSPPGSSFKAFTLATAYKNNYSPNSYLNGNSPWPDQSNPQEVAAAQGDPPVYNESTNDQYGQITINTATADSVNTAFVRLSDQLGYNNVLSTVNSFGINSGNANGLAANARLTLGIADVSTARMASAYSGFADNGELYPLIMVKQIVSQGGVVWKPNDTPTQVLQPNVAETVTSSLFHVTHDAGATAAGVVGLTGGLNNIAGKTGTSTMDLTNIEENYPSLYHYTENGYFSTAAAWFNGYTTKLESAVAVARYVPNPDAGQPGQPPVLDMPVDNINGSGPAYGDSLAVPVWAEFMKLMQNTPFGGDAAFPTPNISQMQIMNSPSASASPSSSPSQQPSDMPTTGGPGQPTPSDSSTCTSGFFGLGNNCTSRSSSPSASATPSASSSSKFGGGNGGIGGQAATESSKEDE